MTQMNYRYKAFLIQTDKGPKWGVSFIDIPNIGGGGNTPQEAYNEALENLSVYFDYLREKGLPIPSPVYEEETEYSGKFVLRLSKSKHRELAELAEREGVSLNSLVSEMVTEGIERRILRMSLREEKEEAFAPSYAYSR